MCPEYHMLSATQIYLGIIIQLTSGVKGAHIRCQDVTSPGLPSFSVAHVHHILWEEEDMWTHKG